MSPDLPLTRPPARDDHDPRLGREPVPLLTRLPRRVSACRDVGRGVREGAGRGLRDTRRSRKRTARCSTTSTQLTKDATRITPKDHERLRAVGFDDRGHPADHAHRVVVQLHQPRGGRAGRRPRPGLKPRPRCLSWVAEPIVESPRPGMPRRARSPRLRRLPAHPDPARGPREDLRGPGSASRPWTAPQCGPGRRSIGRPDSAARPKREDVGANHARRESREASPVTRSDPTGRARTSPAPSPAS